MNVDDELLVVGAALRERVLGEEGRGGRDPPRIRPRRGPIRAPVSERRGGARGGRGRVRLDGRRHRDRAHRPRVRAGGPRHRTRAGMADLQAGRRHRPVQRSRPGVRPWALREGCRPEDHRRPHRARGAPARGDDRARVPVLLAVRHAAPLLRALGVVRPDHRGEGASARGQRVGQLVPRPHQARPLRRLAREQRGLGPVARAVLGHAAADLAVHGRTPDRRRVAAWSSASSRGAT